MGIVVTGIGPRCGTSAMMRELIARGWEPHAFAEPFPSYVAPMKNPKGFWDVSIEHLHSDEIVSLAENEVIKVWSPMYNRVDWSTVDHVIVMHREDKSKQIASILSCAEEEGIEVDDLAIERMFWEPRILLRDVPVNKTYIEIEELRANPREVLQEIKEAI